jgi:hypothetical protein
MTDKHLMWLKNPNAKFLENLEISEKPYANKVY